MESRAISKEIITASLSTNVGQAPYLDRLRSKEVLGQLQVVHTGFRLICVVTQHRVGIISYYQWTLQYKPQHWDTAEDFQCYKG